MLGLLADLLPEVAEELDEELLVATALIEGGGPVDDGGEGGGGRGGRFKGGMSGNCWGGDCWGGDCWSWGGSNWRSWLQCRWSVLVNGVVCYGEHFRPSAGRCPAYHSLQIISCRS